jgi:hypothetical protein
LWLVDLHAREHSDRGQAVIEQPSLPPTWCQNLSDIEAFTRKFKCRCGAIPFRPEFLLHQESLVYDRERLATLKVKCGSCGRVTDLYFVKPASAAMP